MSITEETPVFCGGKDKTRNECKINDFISQSNYLGEDAKDSQQLVNLKVIALIK